MIIGYDRRFLSRQAAEASAEVFAGNNIPTILLAGRCADAADDLCHGGRRIRPYGLASPPATIRRSGTG